MINESFEQLPEMTLAGITVLPIIYWFFKRRNRFVLNIVGALLILVFLAGSIENIGLDSSIIRLLEEFLIGILVLRFFATLKVSRRFSNRGLFMFIMFILISAISTIINDISTLLLFFFLRDYAIVYVFFFVMKNTPLYDKERFKLLRLTLFLFVSQIGSNLIKVLIFRDIVEPYIGSMAILGGSLTIVVSLIGIVVTTSDFLIYRNYKSLLLLAGFISFAMIGGKRSIVLYVPLMFIFLLVIHAALSKKLTLRFVLRIFGVVFSSLFLVYSSIRLFPSLNKEREVWGSFDLGYALEYGVNYVDNGAGAIEEIGRAQAPIYLINKMMNDGFKYILFGYGSGHLVKTSFNKEMVKHGRHGELTESLYGVGYGARSGFLQLLLQVGFFGVLVHFRMVIKLFSFRDIRYFIRADKLQGMLYLLVFTGLFLTYSLDFFTYSTTFTMLSPASLSVFMIIAIIVRRNSIMNMKYL